MYIKKSEFEAIAKVIYNQGHHYTPEGKHFESLPDEMKEALYNADIALINVCKRNEIQNRKTADYIANKRKINKNYAR